MTTTTPYTPGTGLARSVIEFFIANNDEVLDANDITSKFGASKASVPALLKRARECRAIVYNGGLYMLGDLEIAKACVAEDAPSPAPAPAPTPAPVAPPAARSLDSATPAEWDAAAAAVRQQQQTKTPAARGTNATRLTMPGIGELVITYEPMASKLAVSGYKWDPVLDHLAAAPISGAKAEVATIRLPKSMIGAAKAGIQSWHKRNTKPPIPCPCRFRASVSGEHVLIQRIA